MTSPSIDSSAFRHHVDRYLEPLHRDLTTKRKETWRQLKLRTVISAMLILAMAGSGLWNYPGDRFYLWMLVCMITIIGAALFFWCSSPWRKHRDRLKHDVLMRLVPFFGDFSYLPKASMSLTGFEGRGLLPFFNSHHVEDEVEGSHRGVQIRAAEVELLNYYTTHRPGTSGSRKDIEIVFKGVLMEVGLVQPVAGTVVLGTPDLFLKRFEVRDDEGLQRLEMPREDLEAWADDPGAGARLLSGPLLDRVAALVSSGLVHSLRMSWKGKTLAMLLDFDEDFFELPIGGEIDFRRFGKIVEDQLSQLTRVIDLLDIPELHEHDEAPMRTVDERIPRASELDADFEKRDMRGCLPVVILTVAGFCTYMYLLMDQVQPLGALALAFVFGNMAGAGLGYVVSRQYTGLSGWPLLLIGLLGIMPALPDETLDRLPGGQYIKEMKLEHKEPL